MNNGPGSRSTAMHTFLSIKTKYKWGKALTHIFLQIAALALILSSMAAQSGRIERRDRAGKHQPLYSLHGKSLADLKITSRASLPMNMLGAGAQNSWQAAAQAEGQEEFASDRVLIAFQKGTTQAEKQEILSKISLNLGLNRESTSPFFDIVNIAELGPRVDDVIIQLKSDPRVRLAEPDYVVYALETIPNDQYFSYLWGLKNTGQGAYSTGSCTTCSKPGADISATKAWDLATGSSDAIVAVVDSGVDYNHPDLAANIMRDGSKVVGYDFVNKDDDPMDDFGHGTHCAGIIGAVGNNGVGVAGVCWNVKIMPVKCFNASGSGLTSDIVPAIDFAVAHGAHILSNSWGGGGSSQLLLEAIKRAEKAGVLFVAAAGNSAANIDPGGFYPAGYNQNVSNVIAVAATDAYDVLAYFSNYGPKTCDIAAPGYGIYSTLPSGSCPLCSSSGYGFMSGTSMATPHVAGAAALIKARFPGLSLTELKARLLYSADHPSEMEGYTRWGRLNVFNALQSDTIPPGTPSSFSVTQASGTGLRLTWTASGENGPSGTVSAYQVFYNTTFDSDTATMVEPGMTPGPPGASETFDLTGLTPQTSYYVFLRAVDKVGNISPLVSAGPVTTGSAAFFDGAEATAAFATSYGPAWTREAGQGHSGQYSYASSAAIAKGQSSALTLINPYAVSGPTYASFWAKKDLDDSYDFFYLIVQDLSMAKSYLYSGVAGSSPWTRYRIDLSSFAGHSIRLGFTLYTGSSASTAVSHRAWIDDIAFVQLTKGWVDDVEGSPQFVGFPPWSVTTESSSSPTHAWSDSPYSKYKNNIRLPLMQTSSIIPPSNLGSCSLVFNAKLDLEQDRDYLEIYASQDDGANWEYLDALTGTSDWAAYSYDLTGWKQIRVLFLLTTNEALGKDGVYLDDIGVWGEPFASVVTTAASEVTVSLPAGGAASASSLGSAGDLVTGYAALSSSAGGVPYGTAVYSYNKNGVVLFEAGVPASPPTRGARFFVDTRTNVSMSAGSGTVNVDTGFAAVNSNGTRANLNLKLRDSDGTILSQGSIGLAAGEHLAKLLYQLAPDFVLPVGFTSGLGSLEVTSDQPVSVLATRITSNQNGDFLVSSTPVADLSSPVPNGILSFPQVVDGGGYQTTFVLMNTSNAQEGGSVRFYDRNGAALSVRTIGGGSSSTQYTYSIPPGGFFRLVTDGSASSANVGWAQLVPNAGSDTPVGEAIVSSTQRGVIVGEAGYPASGTTTHARIYMDTSSGHDTGLAIGNPNGSAIHIVTTAFQSDGITPAGNGSGSVDLPAMGHDAKLAVQLAAGLPPGFTGVLDFSSSSAFAAMTVRSLTNAANNYIFTIFPIADVSQSPPSPLLFPQVADGGGYQTQVIVLSTSSTASTIKIDYLGNDGSPIAIGRRTQGTIHE